MSDELVTGVMETVVFEIINRDGMQQRAVTCDAVEM